MFNCTNFVKIMSTLLIAGILLSLTGATAYGSSESSIDYKYGYGPIASINNDWILAGHWMGFHNPSNLSDAGFHSTFDMVLINGTAPHMHQISNSTISDVRMEGNNTIIEGAATVTMRDGPVTNVSTTWTISNNNTIAVNMDPSQINDHFGDTPIYGLVLTPDKEMNIMNTMMEDSKFMEKWIPLMMQNVMKTLKMNGDNMTMMPTMNHSMMDQPMILN